MRRLYVLPLATWKGTIQIGIDHADAIGLDGIAVRSQRNIVVSTIDLFHPLMGSHYIDLPNGMILMMTSFAFEYGERHEDLFHAHPDVAILPHPTTDGTMTLRAHVARSTGVGNTPPSGHKFFQQHLDALVSHETLGATANDNVLDLARKAAIIHPEVRFRNVL